MADQKTADDRPWGVITDEGIERLRSRVGVAEPWTNPPHYYAPNVDAFRHVANCYGDDNPLYCDPAYGEKSVWGGIIAPPPMVGGDTLIGEDEVTRVADDQRDLMKGDPLRGVHAFYSASAREWWAPLRPDHRIFRRNVLVAVLDKQSEFAKRAVHEWSANVFRTEENTILCGQYRLMIRTEREKARERGKYDAIEFHPYSDDEIEAIEAAYDRQIAERRGGEPRFFEDVSEGDELTPMVKGPLRVTDMVVWHTGMGMGLYGVKALDLGRGMRQRIPSFIHRDELNVPDVMQRVHWDPEFAKKAGNPTTFDYGRMRETWLIHLCTNWMGDDAWLWKLDCEFRGFNYNGDTQWLHGTIVRKYLADGDRPAVDLEIRCENQRGVVTAPGHATILLPSREHGGVRLPDVPGGATDLQGALTAVSAEFFAQVTDDQDAQDPYAQERYAGTEGLDVAFADRVLTITLDRPDKRNAMNDDMIATFIDAVDEAGRDEAVRVILVRANGDHFCSGFDIVSRNAGKAGAWGDAKRPRTGAIQRRLPSQAHRLIPLMLETQTPIVTRVQGWTAGIGLNLALASDFAVAASDARFYAPFVDRGFSPDSGATWMLPRRIGEVRARDMLLLGRVVDGREAADWGLVHRIVEPDALDAAVDEVVAKLASSATVALGLTKWLLNSGREATLRDHHQHEAFGMELSSRSEDFREGLAAFREKRDPDFQGR